MNPIWTAEDYRAAEIEHHTESLINLEERVKQLEYLVYRLSEKFPDITKTYCAGCKHLVYGRTVAGIGKGAIVEMCTFGNHKITSLKDVNGCNEWRRRG